MEEVCANLGKRSESSNAAALEADQGGKGGVPSSDESAWRQFLAVADVLRAYGALDGWQATELGELVAEVQHFS